MDKQHIFFGYAADIPHVRESLQLVAARLGDHPSVAQSITWEDLLVDGKLIISDIIDAIDSATICVFDITDLNPNVLFELGIATARGKQIIITRDADNILSDRIFREFGLLTTVGYTKFLNSGDLLASMTAILASPPKALLDFLLGQSIDSEPDVRHIVYVPSMKEDEASRALSRVIDSHTGLSVKTLELDEYGTAPLAWLVEQIYRSRTALVHLTPTDAYLAETSNRRASLLAGLSVGFGNHTRIAMRDSASVPLDYRDLRITYRLSKDLVAQVSSWIETLDSGAPVPSRTRKHIGIELAALRFGNHVAEADQEGLGRYFVETRDYLDVVDGISSIFTGRKGTGKTANMLQAAARLRSDARNVVCVIKPASYELEALVEVLGRVETAHIGHYLVEGVWKYLLYAEVAAEVVRSVRSTPAGIAAGSAVERLFMMLESDHKGVDASFSVRLENLVSGLDLEFGARIDGSSIEETRARIGKTLYGGHLKKLRAALSEAIHGKRRVAVLIDNLDKAWERGADLHSLSDLIFGLLTSVGRVSDEFARESIGGGARFTLTAFLRSDIYAFVRREAREPDKINSTEIEWRDQEMLARVLEDRFLDSRDGKSSPSDLWNHYFVSEIAGRPSKDYILSHVQPRPRDLVYFANAAVLQATNAKHGLINQEDIEKAEVSYSQFAYDALVVEGVAAGVDMEKLLYAFVGEKSILDRSDIVTALSEGGIEARHHDEMIRILRQHGFLGIEVGAMRFDYGGTVGEMAKADVLARKLAKGLGRATRFEIHSAYRSHLVVEA
ncbi:P-loop ATPase, Sll1717 family [Promicromonospora sp. NFX87]|uniref:P-loop ATPase, Sll1717 family n=1 Tax=Promicromonospora sp. NFX87 TaxID=3402691 RepID=UPI003AFB75C9